MYILYNSFFNNILIFYDYTQQKQYFRRRNAQNCRLCIKCLPQCNFLKKNVISTIRNVHSTIIMFSFMMLIFLYSASIKYGINSVKIRGIIFQNIHRVSQNWDMTFSWHFQMRIFWFLRKGYFLMSTFSCFRGNNS